MNYETLGGSELPISPQIPKPVVDVTFPTNPTSYSQAVTFVTGAAGLTGRIQLPAPILSVGGAKIASHWRKNKVWAAKTASVTETNGSAGFTIYDRANTLSNIFATSSGAKMYVARITFNGASEIYGYINLVTGASGTYTFTVVNGPLSSTQNWKVAAGGSLPGLTQAIRDVEIYANQNSLTFTTGTVLTEEVPFDFAVTEKDVVSFLNSLSNGQYGVDAVRGRILYKKATTGTSDTVTYNTYTGSGGALAATSMQSLGYDATGQDTYATIKTPSANASHIYITLGGSNDAYISLDGGVTDHIPVAAGSCLALDAVAITSGVAIQAKNKTPGSNYANLGISIW